MSTESIIPTSSEQAALANVLSRVCLAYRLDSAAKLLSSLSDELRYNDQEFEAVRRKAVRGRTAYVLIDILDKLINESRIKTNLKTQ